MKKTTSIVPILLLGVLVLLGCSCNGGEKPPELSFETYTNDVVGFSLEYPSDWYKDDQPQFGFVSFSSKDEEAPMGGVPLGVRVEIFTIPNTEGLGLEEWIEWNKAQGGPEEEVLTKEEITVGGQKAIKEVVTSITVGALPEGAEAGNPISVYVAKDNYIIQINYTGRDTGLETGYWGNIANFEHLLTSFEFTEKSSGRQDGLSFDTAIIIEADNSDDGIAQEYEWLYMYGCSDKGGVAEREMQELQEDKGHKFDLLYAVCNNGEKEVYYFQIDSFYGKW